MDIQREINDLKIQIASLEAQLTTAPENERENINARMVCIYNQITEYVKHLPYPAAAGNVASNSMHVILSFAILFPAFCLFLPLLGKAPFTWRSHLHQM
jgi:hypothetical protein